MIATGIDVSWHVEVFHYSLIYTEKNALTVTATAPFVVVFKLSIKTSFLHYIIFVLNLRLRSRFCKTNINCCIFVFVTVTELLLKFVWFLTLFHKNQLHTSWAVFGPTLFSWHAYRSDYDSTVNELFSSIAVIRVLHSHCRYSKDWKVVCPCASTNRLQ